MNHTQKMIFIIVIVLFAIVFYSFNLTGQAISIQSSPTQNPLITINNISRVGAFRVPSGNYGGSSFSYGTGIIAFSSQTNSLFISGHPYEDSFAEIIIPTLSNSTNIGDLSTASIKQPFVDLSPPQQQNINTLGGLHLIIDNGLPYLLGSSFEFYDADQSVTLSHYVVSNPFDFSSVNSQGYYEILGTTAGHVCDYISKIPSEWQGLLGGDLIVGAGAGKPIIGRTSVGPSAFAINTSNLLAGGQVPSVKLLDYSLTNPLNSDLFNSGGTNNIWTHLTGARYAFIPNGTRTLVVLGYSGGNAQGICYKPCTGGCYEDTCGGYCSIACDDKYPYYWLYDLNDLLDVKQNTINSYDVQPYEYGVFPLPFDGVKIGGGSYDISSGKLFITQLNSDYHNNPYFGGPIVHMFKLTSGTTSTPDTTPPIISNIQESNIVESSATVSWNTNELATVQINYGTTSSLGTILYNSGYGTSHSRTLTSLASSTTYFYEIIAIDQSSNIAKSTIQSFTTTATPALPQVISIDAKQITTSTANITWETNKLTNGTIEYGNTMSLGSSVTKSSMGTSHAKLIANLLPLTTYYYRVSVNDNEGNKVNSVLQQFTTLNNTSEEQNPSQENCDYTGKLPICVSIICNEGNNNEPLTVIKSHTACDDNDICTIDTCSLKGCKHTINTSDPNCVTKVQSCNDIDNDNILDYDAVRCRTGKDLCFEEYNSLSTREKQSLEPTSLFYNYTKGSGEVTGLNDVLLERKNFGQIRFNNPINLLSLNSFGCYESLQLDTFIEIGKKRITLLTDELPELNQPAELTFFGVSTSDFQILKDGIACLAPSCTSVETNIAQGYVVISVDSFSTYELVENIGQSGGSPDSGSGGGGGSGNSESDDNPNQQNAVNPGFPQEQSENCIEEWECEEFKPCTDNLQVRICIDKNACGTQKDKPLISQECTPASLGTKSILIGVVSGIVVISLGGYGILRLLRIRRQKIISKVFKTN